MVRGGQPNSIRHQLLRPLRKLLWRLRLGPLLLREHIGVHRHPRLEGHQKHMEGVVRLDGVEGDEGERGEVAETNGVDRAVQAKDEGGESQKPYQAVSGGPLGVNHHGSGIVLNAMEDLVFHLGFVSSHLDFVPGDDIKGSHPSLLHDLGVFWVEEVEDAWVSRHSVVAGDEGMGELLRAGLLPHHFPDVNSGDDADQVEEPVSEGETRIRRGFKRGREEEEEAKEMKEEEAKKRKK